MSNLRSLDAIGLGHGTDKASVDHDYLEFYESFFAPMRHKNISILEIGVFGGASLKTWREYFTKATIVGADINPDTKQFETDDIAIELLDQSNVDELTKVAIKHGPFDIIIEDGSHMWEHQITSLRTLFPFVRDGGLYIAEDLQTNYGGDADSYKGIASVSCVEYLKSLVDLRVGDDNIEIENVEDAFLRTYGRKVDFVTFYRRACLIKKQAERSAAGRRAGVPIIGKDADPSGAGVSIHAHVSFVGDVTGQDGFVNLGDDKLTIQGFSIDTDENILEYRALVQGQSAWGQWRDGNEFVGTRGQARDLVGFGVRLKNGLADQYRVRAAGRFAGLPHPVDAGAGGDCVSASGDLLCGIQVQVLKRADA